MRCHYITDKVAGRVLIPYCWSVVNTGDILDCHCPRNEKTLEQRIEVLEKKVKELTLKMKEGL